MHGSKVHRCKPLQAKFWSIVAVGTILAALFGSLLCIPFLRKKTQSILDYAVGRRVITSELTSKSAISETFKKYPVIPVMVLISFSILFVQIVIWYGLFFSVLSRSLPLADKAYNSQSVATKQETTKLLRESNMIYPDLFVTYAIASRWATIAGLPDLSMDLSRRAAFSSPAPSPQLTSHKYVHAKFGALLGTPAR